MSRAGFALATVVLVAACGSDTPAVDAAYGSPDSVTLELSTDTCNAHPNAIVDEEGDEVRVSLRAQRSWGDADCADSVRVTLAAPLGSRAVIDTSTGRELEVLPPS